MINKAIQAREQRERKTIDSLKFKPIPEQVIPAEIRTGRRMLPTIDNFEKSYNPIIGQFQSPKLTKRPELDPTGDFFWETRTNNGVKQKSTIPVLLDKALPKLNPYSRTKTTLASEDPDKDYKLKQALDWKNEIQLQIDEKRKRELSEKQRDELEESMLLARYNRTLYQDHPSGLPGLKLKRETVFEKQVPIVRNDEEMIEKVYNGKIQQHYIASLPSKIPRFNLTKKNKEEEPEAEKIVLNKQRVIEPIGKSNQIKVQNQSGAKETERPKQSVKKVEKKILEPQTLKEQKPAEIKEPTRDLLEKRPQQHESDNQRVDSNVQVIKVIEQINSPKNQIQEIDCNLQKTAPVEQIIEFTPSPPKTKPRNQGDLHKRKLKNTDNEMERLKNESLGHLEEIQRILNSKQKEHS